MRPSRRASGNQREFHELVTMCKIFEYKKKQLEEVKRRFDKRGMQSSYIVKTVGSTNSVLDGQSQPLSQEQKVHKPQERRVRARGK